MLHRAPWQRHLAARSQANCWAVLKLAAPQASPDNITHQLAFSFQQSIAGSQQAPDPSVLNAGDVCSPQTSNHPTVLSPFSCLTGITGGPRCHPDPGGLPPSTLSLTTDPLVLPVTFSFRYFLPSPIKRISPVAPPRPYSC